MKNENIKVFLVYKDFNDVFHEESLWAFKKSNNYIVDNAPFFANNLACGDLISVEEDDDRFYFLRLIKASEHSTIQVVLLDSSFEKALIEYVEKNHCFWESTYEGKYYSIDVPQNTDYTKLRSFLDNKQFAKTLDFKEACLSDKHREDLKNLA